MLTNLQGRVSWGESLFQNRIHPHSVQTGKMVNTFAYRIGYDEEELPMPWEEWAAPRKNGSSSNTWE